MIQLKDIIKETVDEVMAQLERCSLQEYGPEWNSKLDGALTDLEERMKKYEDPPFEQLLMQIQAEYGLSDYEVFLVGENSTYPTPDESWKQMGPRFAKFIGRYPENVGENLPLSGEEKYSKQEPGGDVMGTSNVSTATWREDKEVAPDATSTKALIQYMQKTYNMNLIGINQGDSQHSREYIFRKNDGTEYRYTYKDLKNFGTPITMGGLYYSSARKQSPYKRTPKWRKNYE